MHQKTFFPDVAVPTMYNIEKIEQLVFIVTDEKVKNSPINWKIILGSC